MWYTHRLYKWAVHLYGKTLSMFCKRFGKSAISQNASGEHPHSPVCAPTKIKTGHVPVLFLVRDHGTTPATQLPVRQQVDLISHGAIKSLRLPRRHVASMRAAEGIECAPTTLRVCDAGLIPYNYLVCAGATRANKFANGSGTFSGLYGHAGFRRYARSVDI